MSQSRSARRGHIDPLIALALGGLAIVLFVSAIVVTRPLPTTSAVTAGLPTAQVLVRTLD